MSRLLLWNHRLVLVLCGALAVSCGLSLGVEWSWDRAAGSVVLAGGGWLLWKLGPGEW